MDASSYDPERHRCGGFEVSRAGQWVPRCACDWRGNGYDSIAAANAAWVDHWFAEAEAAAPPAERE